MTAQLLIRRCAAAISTAAVLLFSASAVAHADGGQTIASATPVVVGQLELGNTLNGGLTTDGLGGYDSYWGLSVTNGDNVTIAWQALIDLNGNGPVLSAYEVGTTAATLGDVTLLQSNFLGPNGQDVMTFTADMTGVMPLQFESNECCIESLPGPYQFIATVTHAVALTIPAVTSISPAGTLGVGVATPDGAAITDPALVVALQARAAGQPWTTIGTASPSAGTAKISYSVPSSLKGRTVSLQALAQGAAYQTRTSSSRSVDVAMSGTGTATGTGSGSHGAHSCIVPSLLGNKLGHAMKVLKGAGCHLGHVRHAHAGHSKHGRVLHQSLDAGARLRAGAKVNLVVGR